MHKVAETLGADAALPYQVVHECTAYLCCHCFGILMGPAAGCDDPERSAQILAEAEQIAALVNELKNPDRPP